MTTITFHADSFIKVAAAAPRNDPREALKCVRILCTESGFAEMVSTDGKVLIRYTETTEAQEQSKGAVAISEVLLHRDNIPAIKWLASKTGKTEKTPTGYKPNRIIRLERNGTGDIIAMTDTGEWQRMIVNTTHKFPDVEQFFLKATDKFTLAVNTDIVGRASKILGGFATSKDAWAKAVYISIPSSSDAPIYLQSTNGVDAIVMPVKAYPEKIELCIDRLKKCAAELGYELTPLQPKGKKPRAKKS